MHEFGFKPRKNATASAPKILVVHSRYRFSGGEERAVELEEKYLTKRGLLVRTLFQNEEIHAGSLRDKALTAAHVFLNGPHTTRLLRVIEEFDPDVIHFHNLMPHWGYISLEIALKWALRKGRRVLSTIHNQRWVCANGLFFRKGAHCQKCLDSKNPLWGLTRNCRENPLESLVYTSAISWAWTRNLYNHPSHTLIALNAATQQRLQRLFPVAKVNLLPNPVDVSIDRQAQKNVEMRLKSLKSWEGPQIAVIGRLSQEKGIAKILSLILNAKCGKAEDAVLLNQRYRFIFAGDGPLGSEVKLASKTNQRIISLGKIPENEVAPLLQTVGNFFHGSLVEEQSPTVLRMAALLKIPLFTYHGRVSPQALNQWGPLFSIDEWSKRFTSLLLSTH